MWSVDEELPDHVWDMDRAVIAFLHEDRPLTRKEIFKWIINNIACHRNQAAEALWDDDDGRNNVRQFRLNLEEAFVGYWTPLRIDRLSLRLRNDEARYSVSRSEGQRTLDWCMYDQSPSAEPFRFLDLPPELRKHIYELIFEFREGAIFVPKESPKYLTNAERGMDHNMLGDVQEADMLRLPPVKEILQLLLVSKHMYEESCSLFFRNNVWQFPDQDIMSEYLENMPATYRQHIKEVSVQYNFVGRRLWGPFDGLRSLAQLQGLKRLTICLQKDELQARMDDVQIRCDKAVWLSLLPGMLSLRRLRGMELATFLGCPVLESMAKDEMEMPGPRPDCHYSKGYEVGSILDLRHLVPMSEEERMAFHANRLLQVDDSWW